MRYFFRRVKKVIKNLIRWFPILIHDRDFDYNYLLIIMNKKLKHMEDFFLKGNTFSKDAERYGKDIKIARILTDRLIEDDYSSYPNFKNDVRRNMKHRSYLKQQDLNYLCDLMKKKLLCWWD